MTRNIENVQNEKHTL